MTVYSSDSASRPSLKPNAKSQGSRSTKSTKAYSDYFSNRQTSRTGLRRLKTGSSGETLLSQHSPAANSPQETLCPSDTENSPEDQRECEFTEKETSDTPSILESLPLPEIPSVSRPSKRKSSSKSGLTEPPVISQKRMQKIEKKGDDNNNDSSALPVSNNLITRPIKRRKPNTDTSIGPLESTQDEHANATITNESNFEPEINQVQGCFELELSQSQPDPTSSSLPTSHSIAVINEVCSTSKSKLSKKMSVQDASKRRRLQFGYQTNDSTGVDQSLSQIEQLHEKADRQSQFHKRFKDPDAIDKLKQQKPSNLIKQEDEEHDSPNKEELGTESNDESNRNSRKKKPRGKAATRKLNALDQQFFDIKSLYPNLILAIQSGYQFLFFAQDAMIVSQLTGRALNQGKLTIMPDDKEDAKYSTYARLRITDKSLDNYISRIVAAGYKVGRVDQVEAAAIKTVENSKGCFERKLAQIYSKATMFNRDMRTDTTVKSEYMVAIAESSAEIDVGTSFNRTPKSIHNRIGLIAIQPTTGDIIYDEFIDNHVMHPELETRLVHIQPVEIFYVGKVHSTTKKLVKQLIASKFLTEEPVIETLPRQSYFESEKYVNSFYSERIALNAAKNPTAQHSIGKLFDLIAESPELVQVCLAALIKYLIPFKLESIFHLRNNFSSFTSSAHMNLPSHTISSLEIFQTQAGTVSGSLFDMLNFTSSRYGYRRLKRWLERPLIDKAVIDERINASKELAKNISTANTVDGISLLKSKLGSAGDLEAVLVKIYYRKCKPSELFWFLIHISGAASIIIKGKPFFDRFESKPLRRIFTTIPKGKPIADQFLREINQEGAKINDLTNFFENLQSDMYQEVEDSILQLHFADTELNEYIEEQRQVTKIHSLKRQKYINKLTLSVHKNEFAKVPDDWTIETKNAFYRTYQTKRFTKLAEEMDYCRQKLDDACKKAYDSFLASLSEHYDELRIVISALADLDCYLSLAMVAKTQVHYCCPKFVNFPFCDINQGRHPMVELLNASNPKFHYIPNDTRMSNDMGRATIITGPNMGGKSSYVRQTALIIIMAQCGFHVPAESVTLGVFDAIFTRMGAYDNIFAGRSTFETELRECAEILRLATPRSLVILDEVGRGTATTDGVAIAHAVLETCIRDIKAFTLFITHYPSVTKLVEKYSAAGNIHMDHRVIMDNGTKKVVFLYKVAPGACERSLGINVARLAGLPGSITEYAERISKEKEREESTREGVSLIFDMSHFIELVNQQSQYTNPELSSGEKKILLRLLSKHIYLSN